MKRATVIIFLIVFSVPNCFRAQSTDDLLQNIASGDTGYSRMEYIQKYHTSDVFAQRTMRQSILGQLEQELGNENRRGAISLASLFLDVADSNDASVPVVLYIAGENYANLGDTTNLKTTILRLEQYSRRAGDPLNGLLNPLNDYLIRYRNAVPTAESLEGFWISDAFMTTANIDFIGSPYMLMRVRNEGDSVSVEISPHSYVTYMIKNDVQSVFAGTRSQYSQIVKPYGKDSLYICWSSSRIVNKSDIGVQMLRMTTSEISSSVVAKYSQRNKYSFSEQLAATAITGLVEVGVNALLDEIFMPKKKDFVMQARLCVKNECLIEGTLHYSSTVLRADGRANNKENVRNIRFIRWKPESNVVFSTANKRPLLPDDRDVWKYKKDTSTFFHNAFSIPKSKARDYVYQYNLLQIRRLGMFDDNWLRERGIVPTGIFELEKATGSGVFCGFNYLNITPELKKKYFLHSDSGVMVSEIAKEFPAYFSPLHRGDVILSIDGIPVKDSLDFKKMELKRDKMTYFRVKRGTKERTVKVEPIFYFWTEDKKQ